METTMTNPPLNDTQILLLQTFARINNSQERDDIQSLLLDYYQKRVDAQTSQVHFSTEKIDEILNSHYRTSYK